jgi:hypothetical protein
MRGFAVAELWGKRCRGFSSTSYQWWRFWLLRYFKAIPPYIHLSFQRPRLAESKTDADINWETFSEQSIPPNDTEDPATAAWCHRMNDDNTDTTFAIRSGSESVVAPYRSDRTMLSNSTFLRILKKLWIENRKMTWVNFEAMTIRRS